jgi:hypothetical protein
MDDFDKLQQFGWMLYGACMHDDTVCRSLDGYFLWWMTIPFFVAIWMDPFFLWWLMNEYLVAAALWMGYLMGDDEIHTSGRAWMDTLVDDEYIGRFWMIIDGCCHIARVWMILDDEYMGRVWMIFWWMMNTMGRVWMIVGWMMNTMGRIWMDTFGRC